MLIGRMFQIREHRYGEIFRKITNVLAFTNVPLQHSQEGADSGVFMFCISTGDDHFVAAEFEGHFAPGRHPQRLADRLGQGDLPLGGNRRPDAIPQGPAHEQRRRGGGDGDQGRAQMGL